MAKLISLSLLLATIFSGQAFSISTNQEETPCQVLISNTQNQSNFESLNKILPYSLSQTEINNLPEGQEKIEAQELYNFMKLSFNVISNKKEELNKLFFSPHSDIALIHLSKSILNNPDNYKHLGQDYMQYYESAKNILYNNKSEYKQYTKDIMHNNLYSASYDTIIENYQLDANCFQKVTRDYINNSIIQQICNNIQDKYRRGIINSVLNNYLLHKTPENISVKDYEEHLIRMNGIHRDMYDNYTNHIIFSGLGPNTFMQIINSLDNSNINSQLQNFKFLVLEGYITDPRIVDYMKTNYK